MPPVSRYMSVHPHAIGPREKLSTARRLMASASVHHLPVVDDAELIGIVSDRDMFPVHPLHDITVEEAMSEDVVTVDREDPIDRVIELMEQRHCNSVVVTGDDEIAGIFTTSDALRALGDLLRRNVENEP